MKTTAMTIAIGAMLLIPATGRSELIGKNDIDRQNDNFRQLWGSSLSWRFDHLPLTGRVHTYRTPYSGFIYPDKEGGTRDVLRKYDAAFHGGNHLATRHEDQDIRNTAKSQPGFLGIHVRQTPHWAGHCNGWVSAAIRHAAPRKSVERGGVEFTPADIKGLLAELYVYNRSESLGGDGAEAINPGLLHVILTNWIGRRKYGIAMDSTVGEEVWNYPIYAYSSSSKRRGPRTVEVRLNLGYVGEIGQETQEPSYEYRYLPLHYQLTLDDDGKIVGGAYYTDSKKVDFFWVPLSPVQGGRHGNEQGNPHLDIKKVMDLWSESVPAQIRRHWNAFSPRDQGTRVIASENVWRTIR